MIVVEGPDGAGKTTLVNAIAESLAIPIIPKVVSAQATDLVDLKVWTETELDRGFKPYRIYDRFNLISDPIYRPILAHRKPDERMYEMIWFFAQIHKFYELNPVILYCLPPLDHVIQNLTDDSDNEVPAPHILQIYHSYIARAALDIPFGHALLWDYTKMSITTMLDIIYQRLDSVTP